jgi:hypothetical protein
MANCHFILRPHAPLSQPKIASGLNRDAQVNSVQLPEQINAQDEAAQLARHPTSTSTMGEGVEPALIKEEKSENGTRNIKKVIPEDSVRNSNLEIQQIPTGLSQPAQVANFVTPPSAPLDSPGSPERSDTDKKDRKKRGVPHVYHDYSKVPDTIGFVRKKTGGVTQPFPEKLMVSSTSSSSLFFLALADLL